MSGENTVGEGNGIKPVHASEKRGVHAYTEIGNGQMLLTGSATSARAIYPHAVIVPLVMNINYIIFVGVENVRRHYTLTTNRIIPYWHTVRCSTAGSVHTIIHTTTKSTKCHVCCHH